MPTFFDVIILLMLMVNLTVLENVRRKVDRIAGDPE